jgi:hypothetical protein
VRYLLLIALLACGSSSPSATGPSRPEETARVPPEGPFDLPASYTACHADADCTVVARGCCDETPVNRAHADSFRSMLIAARGMCPVKAACGPSAAGTWDGQPGKCEDAACTLPPWP